MSALLRGVRSLVSRRPQLIALANIQSSNIHMQSWKSSYLVAASHHAISTKNQVKYSELYFKLCCN